ncbi:transcriptional regulator [Streptomyces spiroverticillatus]|uniref:Transcriptional regulator n=1 Tax=Streptomyces finlayi TaxID=67296 RepID=A0A919C7K8_9ACTN|nr:helix-turn-helix transcriptional regulator [Streptomyces finlayi]GGZ87594.1 transcriptional regulator [Streptomyces spiroverticillatus]GHC78766.1 transcriptional regulator [Streptomyces finlayi]
MSFDPEAASPTLCRLQLGNELRAMRLAMDLKAATVCKQLIWSPSKLSRLESGDNTIVEPSVVIALCDTYGAEPEQKQRLVGYAKVTKTKTDWWDTRENREVIQPGASAFFGLESTASVLQTYEAEFVPGLLQTEAYVRAISKPAHRRMWPEDKDKVVKIRMTRQEVLRRKRSPLKYTAIINEAVLHRVIGSHALMREQLTHIAHVMEAHPNVRIQIVPFAAGAHPGMDGKFSVLHFPPRTALKPLVYLENRASTWVIRQTDAIQQYEEAFADLSAIAAGPDESLDMIKRAIEEHS